MERCLTTSLVVLLAVCGLFFVPHYYAMQIFSPELCCGDMPLKVDDNLRCCGNVSFTPIDSICCFDGSRGHYVLDLPPPVAPPASARRASRGSISSSTNRNSNNGVSLLAGSLSSSAGGSGSGNARFLSCCGDEVFDFRFYTCCDGAIHKQSSNGNTGCCGRRTYDPYTQLCCKKTILPKETFTSFCCGARAYDHATQVCCADAVYDVDAGSGGSTDNYGCCGDKIFTATQLCCQGNRMEKATANSYCCGSSQFDFETQLCCNNERVVTKTSPGEFCCGTHKTYDTTTHVCCVDNVIPKKRATPAISVGGSVQSKSGSVTAPPLSKRFNLFPIDEDEDILCCANATYDWKHEICCDGRVVARPNQDGVALSGGKIKCCGQQAFDDETHLCCQKRVSEKRSRAEDCCGSSGKTFNVQTQVCCQGVIHDLNPDSLSYCCGNSTFDPERDTCCNGRRTAKRQQQALN